MSSYVFYPTLRSGCWALLVPAFLLVVLAIFQSLSTNTVQASRLYSYMDGNGVLHVTNIPLDAGRHGYQTGLAMGKDVAGTIVRAATYHGLDPDLVGAVVKIESGGAIKAISPKGARGPMQLMPETARELGIVDPSDPRANIWGGTRYLKMLLTRFDGDVILALAAYNAGPGRVKRFGGVPPFRETREYIRRVIYQWKENRAGREASR